MLGWRWASGLPISLSGSSSAQLVASGFRKDVKCNVVPFFFPAGPLLTAAPGGQEKPTLMSIEFDMFSPASLKEKEIEIKMPPRFCFDYSNGKHSSQE